MPIGKPEITWSITCKIVLCATMIYSAVSLPYSGSSSAEAARAASGTVTLAAAGSGELGLEGALARLSGEQAPEELRRFAADAISKLATAEPFTAWAGASANIEPLGPGTHSWLVTITPPGAAAPDGDTAQPPPASAARGYLIISATERGDYKLVEYGFGTYAVFDQALLEAALREGGLGAVEAGREGAVPLYAGPALTAWVVRQDTGEPQYVNAADGEWLPETPGSWDKQAAKYTPPRQAASSRSTLAPERLALTAERFDPYDNLLWMTGESVTVDTSSFIAKLKASKQLVFAASGQDRTYSFPLAVYGYQTWTGGSSSQASDPGNAVYVVTSSDSTIRVIALDALTSSGKFTAY